MRITSNDIRKFLMDPDNGFDFHPVAPSIQVMQDPQVDGTFAVRFADEGGVNIDLMFVTGWEAENATCAADVLEDTLEEVEYETWPPRSGSLRFC